MKVQGNMFIQTIEISGFKGAIFGMRNPMNSWHMSDSHEQDGVFIIGENDLKLAKNLVKGGAEHRKFLRMIQVQFNLNMPRYIWSEFDTYSFNTKNSCSTMHKLLNVDDTKNREETELDVLLNTRGELTLENFVYYNKDEELMNEIINRLNLLREEYTRIGVTAKDKKEILRRAKMLLPEGYLQMRTVSTNYEELMNIYKQRNKHRLDVEWGMICDYIVGLPYMMELMGFEM